MSNDYDIELETGSAYDQTADVLVVLIPQDEDGDPELGSLPELPTKQLDRFDGDKLETASFYDGAFEADCLVLLGCGREEDFEPALAAELGGKAIGLGKGEEAESLRLVFPLFWSEDRSRLAREFALGLKLGGYEFDQYQHEDDEEDDQEQPELERVVLQLEDKRSLSTVQRGFERGLDVSRGVRLARDLGNTPANDLTPMDLAERAQTVEQDHEFVSVKVWDQEKLIEEDMHLLNAVGKGSTHPPCFIELDYVPDSPKGTLGVAGKGVTFDTGGISIKPSKKMDEMKFDMGGSAAVIGLLDAVARLEWPVRVLGFVPAAENMPGHASVKPGDVITGRAGKSVEILNTDAEGRLCLADALGYLSETYGEELDCLLDFATLTGACITALGHEAAGLMGIDDELCERLTEAGELVDERVWQLPLWEDHTEQMKSEIADVKNIGGDAGTITAGAFLREFVDEDVIDRWAHLDIAGTAWGMEELSYRPTGGTGFGVHLAVEFIRDEFSID